VRIRVKNSSLDEKGKEVVSSFVKGIVSQDWEGLQMVSLERFEVQMIPYYVCF
jgi:hypothetical protein